jgi:hypothetical protein
MRFTILASLLLAFVSASSDGLRHTISTHLDSNMIVVVDRAMAQLETALFPENKKMAKGLRAQLNKFKDHLVKQMKVDMEEELQMAVDAKKDSGPVTADERQQFFDKLHARWELTIKMELNDWRQGHLTSWLNQVKHVWTGMGILKYGLLLKRTKLRNE